MAYMSDSHSSTKAIFYAFSANLGIAIAKGVATVITGSGSMMAETIHSLADCINQLLLFWGLKRAQIPPSKEYPLGHGKVIYFWSFIVAMLLFGMGGIFSIYEGIHKLVEAKPLTTPYVAIAVLISSLLLESGSLFGAVKEIIKIKKDQTFFQWLFKSRSAELIVVFGEDVAALLGLFFALLFLLLALYTGNPVYDAYGSIFIGALLIVVSIFIITRIKAMIIGRSADPEIVEFIEKEVSANENIEKLLKVISVQMGPDIMISIKILMNERLKINEACVVINEFEKKIKARYPEIKWSFVEPDIAD